MIRKFLQFEPVIDESAFVDESAVVIGRVFLKGNVSIWPGAFCAVT
jgi:carbonic anhydrase/acetyltransferase-like protein (isoleucine patch superfamily)